MQLLIVHLLKTGNLIFLRFFSDTLQTYVYQWSEFKVGTTMGLAVINHSTGLL